MLTKYLLTAALIVIAWMVVTRLQRGKGKRTDRSVPPIVAQETVKCPSCGIYLPLGQTCSCADRT